ncbi:NPC intracellular cholesterol transporter 2-like isoform X3 [Lineus longissimus]|uniref:NPC intracellular cholesterol transporter 2-like isoform X3 n=1 Tax=Lineus longissimus TaxID=88925 RepID=UPI00315D32B9
MKALIPVLLALVAFDSGMSTPFKDCGSKAGKVESVDIATPGGRQGFLVRGEKATLTVVFTSYSQSKTAVGILKGNVSVWVLFTLPNPDACTQGVTCPMSKGTRYTFKTSVNIYQEYPPIRVEFQLQLKDDNYKDIICVRFPSEIM